MSSQTTSQSSHSASGEDIVGDEFGSSSSDKRQDGNGDRVNGSQSSSGAVRTSGQHEVAPKAIARTSLSSGYSGDERLRQSVSLPAPPTTPPHASEGSHLPYSQEEIERVRQALASAGYPAPSTRDIERVFQHVRSELERQQRDAEVYPRASSQRDSAGNAPGDETRYRTSTSAAVSASEPHHHRQRQRKPWDASVPMTAPRYQGPRRSVDRSEPYRRAHGGREDDDNGRRGIAADTPSYYRRGPPANNVPVDPHHPALYLNPAVRLERYMRRYERDLAAYHNESAHAPCGEAYVGNSHVRDAAPRPPCATRHADSRGADFQASHVLIAPLEENTVAWRSVDAAALRRSANTVFDVTGDERYRYRPPMSKPRNAVPPYTQSGRRARAPGHAGDYTVIPSTVPMPETCYNAQRPDRRPRASRSLSTYTVGYLQSDGSTLRTKADPVKRGHQMRELWERDAFLSQRGWNTERWLTRQATMNYDDA